MFEIEKKGLNEIVIKTANRGIIFDLAQGLMMAELAVGVIEGPGEFEIGEASIRGISVANHTKTIYGVDINGVHIGLIGDFDENLDELGMPDILCTSSVKAIREVSPKLVIATGNVDGMLTELKLDVKLEKKVKIKRPEDLPSAQEVIVLN